jgi:hypothetical protein
MLKEGFAESKIFKIPNGVDATHFTPKSVLEEGSDNLSGSDIIPPSGSNNSDNFSELEQQSVKSHYPKGTKK